MFIDEVTIHVKAGRGGHGCVSFRRERCVPLGGPDGGDGGRGGSIFVEAQSRLNSLRELRYRKRFKATSGQCGAGRVKTGRSGEDLTIPVPCGTVVIDAETDRILFELLEDGDRQCVVAGGQGGLGNVHFKSSTNRSPRQHTEGEWGEERLLRLELRLLADVGLLGFPNAGKSSLLRALSAATPKVASYPFTTLEPVLGVVDVDAEHAFLLADVPGILEGAADGVGLGLRFLKHLSRCRLLLHVVSCRNEEGLDTMVADIRAVQEEVCAYGEEVARLPRWLIINKMDLLPAEDHEAVVQSLREDLGLSDEDSVFLISTVTQQGLKALVHAVSLHLRRG